MKIGLLHLSDIHIENENDWICDKSEDIAKAILGTWENLEVIFIVVSGDIANRGITEQYLFADEFLQKIKNYIENHSNSVVHFIVAPGNHDCDLSGEKIDTKSRKSFINSVIENPLEIEINDGIYDGCLKVQEDFFDFAKSLEKNGCYPQKPAIYYELRFEIKERVFVFNIFNTSWISQLKEDQGKMYFPTHLLNIDSVELSKCFCSISVFHHPDNWLDSSNAFEFRNVTEKHSDIILSGHEHTREIFTKKSESNGETQIIRAEALQERSNPTSSSFNLVIVDTDEQKQKNFRFKWIDNHYANKGETEWQDYIRNRFLQSQNYYLNPNFERELNSFGSLTSHTRKRDVKLDDLFVAPNLLVTSLKNIVDGKNELKKIESNKFYKFIFDYKALLIFGETWQGKTTIAKKVFKEFYQKQYVTLMVDGSNFDKASEDSFKSRLKTEFSRQYEPTLWERFLQLPNDKRALVIDNFDQSNLNPESLQKILEIAKSKFDYVIVFAHTNLSLQQYVKNGENSVRFSDYLHCKILSLNQTQRTQIIRNWIRLNADSNIQNNNLIKEENRLRIIVNTAINNGLIQSFPFFILSILQLIDNFRTDSKAKFGSIGYIHNTLVTNNLTELDKNPEEINAILLVISLIAYWLYKNDQTEINLETLTQIINKYNSEYTESLHPEKFINELIQAKVLQRTNADNLSFVGVSLRDFFVSKYYFYSLGDELDDVKEEAQRDIESMIKTILYEPHSRILLFLVFEANTNKKLVRWILEEAKKIYASFETATLTTDVEFLNNLDQTTLNQNLLGSINPLENHDQKDLESDDEIDDESIEKSLDKSKLVEYSDECDNFTKAAISLKMIELVGQLVKSFSGTIRTELKNELIKECVDIGLRFLRSILELHSNNIDELSTILKELIQKQHPSLSISQVEKRTDEIILVIHHGLTYGVVKKISFSVGHSSLKDSFHQVFSQNTNLSYQIVETAIRLDHYDSLDEEKVISFGKDIKENTFVLNILRRLVADYMNYFEVTGARRQKLSSAFNISENKQYLLTSTKGERDHRTESRKPNQLIPNDSKKRR